MAPGRNTPASLSTSLIFWWPVVQPWPSRAQWPRWAMVPYLLIADLQNTALSAILVFSDRVLYPSYSAVPRLFGFSALEDQVAAGAIMWVVGSLAFVVPAVIIAVQCLSKKSARPEPAAARKRDKSFDDGLLHVSPAIPLVPRFLRVRLTTRRLEAVWFVVLFVAIWLLALFDSWQARATTTIRPCDSRGTSGQFAVAVFAPVGRSQHAGASPFSVLVQDRNTSRSPARRDG